ncbi:MAG: hypothetical protein CVV61_07515 [Tenericutes bacterium HGW-Tenericutes-6]|nr:MAG: hypothetical protein CVV61_07515 [Tenericutes bacterium HGW-Tenericutes-6]
MFFAGSILKSLKIGGFHKKLVNEMLVYSLPLIPNALMWLIITSVSKVFIQFHFGNESVGIYGFATKIPLILSQVTAIFMSAWQISAVENVGKNKDDFSRTTFNIFYTIGFLIVSVEMIFNKFLIYTFVSQNYQSSYRYIPIIFLATSLIGFSSFFGSVYIASKKTFGALISTIIAAIVNILIIFIFIRDFGLFGVSYAMLISCIIVLIYRVLDTRIRFSYKIISYHFYLSLIVILIGVILYNSVFSSVWINVSSAILIIIINIKTIIYVISKSIIYFNSFFFNRH